MTKMKFVVTLSLLFATICAIEVNKKYENIDIDAVLANSRLTTNYVKCLLEKGKCSEEGATLKSVIPDALISGCAKCTDKQKESVKKVVKFLIKNRKGDWDELVAKYDPEGVHRKNYQHYKDELAKESS